MKCSISRLLVLMLAACLLLSAFPPVSVFAAEAEDEQPVQAKEISGKELVTHYEGFQGISYLFDGNEKESYRSSLTSSLTLEHEEGIGSLYIRYHYEYGPYTVTDNSTGKVATVGTNYFLHEFIDLVELFGYAPKSVTIDYTNGRHYIIEIHAFTAGEVPSFVQKWQAPADDRTDLILFSTHGDDDQLFFAGLLPYYSQVRNYQVQVVYLTNHRNNSAHRIHEMLNGLWAVGITAYPVFGPYNDFLQKTIVDAYFVFRSQGVSKSDIVGFCTEQLRRFNPKVIVAHDFQGEYGHGQHMVYADCVAAALEASNDPEQYPESCEKYGLWDVPKAYFHLYEENAIVMDWDTPYDELNGMTPFQVTQQLGYPCHESQQFTKFTHWIRGYNDEITRADQIETSSPCKFGLYRSTVGEDVLKNDMFENLHGYAEQDRLDAEEAARLEEERLAAEEAARMEAERLAAEEAAQKEAERLAAEEAARIEAERLEAEHLAEQAAALGQMLTIAGCVVAGLVVVAAVLILLIRRKNPQNKKMPGK